jgi:hypothetical protein
MSIYVTLQADIGYSHNTFSNFYSVLDQPLVLSDSYEVGLTEIIYPVDYKANYGSMRFKVPSYMIFEERPNYLNQSAENDAAYVSATLDQVEKSRQPVQKAFFELLNEYLDIEKSDSDKAKQILIEMNKNYELLDEAIGRGVNVLRRFSTVGPHALKLFKIYSDIHEQYMTVYKKLVKFEHNTVERNQIIHMIRNLSRHRELLLSKNQSNIDIEIELSDRLEKARLADEIHKHLSPFYYFKNNVFSLKPYVEIENISENLNHLFIHEPKKLEIKSIARSQHIKFFKIMTNIIDDSLVFNKNQAILKLFKAEGAFSDLVERVFDRPQYHSTNRTYISKIQIQIVDQNNKYVNFVSTPILKLHFRLKRK